MNNNYLNNGVSPPQLTQYQQQLPPTMTATTVYGKARAKDYLVVPNTTVILLNAEEDFMWIKSVDASGYTTNFREFKLEEVKPKTQSPEFISRNEFEKWQQSTNNQLQQILGNLNLLIGGFDKNVATNITKPANVQAKA